MRRRDFLLTCAGLATASVRAQGSKLQRDLAGAASSREGGALAFQAKPAPAPAAAAPANAWPQFRGSPTLTGISSTTLSPAPKLAWAWEGGEAFDSSAAIVDGVVYVGTATGELIAVGLSDGRSEEHTSELQSQSNLVCRLLLEKKKKKKTNN